MRDSFIETLCNLMPKHPEIVLITGDLGFGVLNLFGHDAEGPANKLWVNIIAPFEGNHKDHHEESIP